MGESSERPRSGSGDVGEARVELPVPGGHRQRAEEWALVLASQGVKVRIRPAPDGFALELARAELPAAEAAIEAYLRENRDSDQEHGGEEESEAPPLGEPSLAGLGVGAALFALYGLTGERGDEHLLFARGSADAARILAGEWWRCVTALCLHANLAHVLGNALAGLYFIGAVCRSCGTGLGLALILLAGASGNLLNALNHTRFHDSVGASTAIFGAIGLLAGMALARRQRAGLRGARLWLPIGAGLGLLAMLGTGGVRVDLWAHFLGLLAGGVLGTATARWLPKPPPRHSQWLLGCSSALVLAFCWSLALR